MPLQVQVHRTTRALLAAGVFPTPPSDPNLVVMTLTDPEAAKLTQRGTKTVAANGVVTVTLDPALVAAETAAETAAQAARTETIAASDSLRTTLAAANTTLDAMIARNG